MLQFLGVLEPSKKHHATTTPAVNAASRGPDRLTWPHDRREPTVSSVSKRTATLPDFHCRLLGYSVGWRTLGHGPCPKQRYVLGERSDEGRSKVELAKSYLRGPLKPVAHQKKWAEFVRTAGYDWPHVLVALDTAADRRSVQASLPKWIANSWTQPGDLGLSVHGQFDGPGACLSCLYLLTQPALKAGNRFCICEDSDYLTAYRAKYGADRARK